MIEIGQDNCAYRLNLGLSKLRMLNLLAKVKDFFIANMQPLKPCPYILFELYSKINCIIYSPLSFPVIRIVNEPLLRPGKTVIKMKYSLSFSI